MGDGLVVQVPGGAVSAPPETIDLGPVLEVEGRLQEVAFVTPAKAPELLDIFNRAWLTCAQRVSRLSLVRDQLRARALDRKSAVILDEADDILKGKGLTPTKDLRDAVLARDPAYAQLQADVDEVSAMIDYLKNKAKAFENGFTAVKAIVKTGDVMRGAGGGFRPLNDAPNGHF